MRDRRYGYEGDPAFNHKNLVDIVENIKPTCLIGAVGVAPGCFDKGVVDMLMKVRPRHRVPSTALRQPHVRPKK